MLLFILQKIFFLNQAHSANQKFTLQLMLQNATVSCLNEKLKFNSYQPKIKSLESIWPGFLTFLVLDDGLCVEL